MSSNIYAGAVTIYSATPGAGLWLIDCQSTVNTAASTITLTVTVGGRTIYGASVAYTKSAGITSVGYPVQVLAAAAEAVTITIQSSNSSDTAVTLNAPTAVLQAVNTAQVGSTTQTAKDIGAAVPAAAPGAKGGLPITDASTGLLLTGHGGGEIAINVGKVSGTAQTAKDLGASVTQTADVGTRIPQIITMAQIGGAGAYYVEVLTSDGAVVGTSTLTQTEVTGGAYDVTNASCVIHASGNWNTTTPPTAAAIVTALWTDLLASTDFAASLSIGKLLKDYIDAAISSRHHQGDAVAKSPATLAAGDVTGNLPADVQTVKVRAVTDVGSGNTVYLSAAAIPTVTEMNARTLPTAEYATAAAVGAIPTDKTGYSLAATGLDAITATEPSTKPTTFPGWIMWLVQRFRRTNKAITGGVGAIVVKTEAGTTVTTQAITDDDVGTETLGAPS